MRNFDFSSWSAVLSTLLGLVLVSLVAVGIRMLVMHTIQRRRERENRQINERLKTLIAAYKVLGGSFTGELEVVRPACATCTDAPRRLRPPDARRRRPSRYPSGADGYATRWKRCCPM